MKKITQIGFGRQQVFCLYVELQIEAPLTKKLKTIDHRGKWSSQYAEVIFVGVSAECSSLHFV